LDEKCQISTTGLMNSLRDMQSS